MRRGKGETIGLGEKVEAIARHNLRSERKRRVVIVRLAYNITKAFGRKVRLQDC